MPIFLKVFNLAAAAVFAVFSTLQWNDLDPAIYDNPSIVDAATWGIFYGFVAILFAVVLIRRLSRWMLILAVVSCLIELGRTAPGLWENIIGDAAFNITRAGMSADDPRIELSREFFGALIALFGIGIIAFENTRWGRAKGKGLDSDW